MSTISKERLEQLASGNAWVCVQDDEAAELARIALASLEAEPVAYSLIFRNMDGVLNDYVNANTTFSTIEKAQAYGRGGNYVRQNDGSMKWVSDPSLDPVVIPLFTAPPAPVSVPAAMEMDDDFDSAFEHGKAVGWNACRAAMLQGAEPVTPAYKSPDDFDFDRFNDVVWLEAVASNPHMHSPTTSTIAMVALGLNRKLADCNSPVIPNGWKLVPIDPTKDMLRAGQSVVGFWLNTVHCYSKMLAAAPAAPRQEA
ncbi:TPA: hypothetical protein ACPFN3_000671 [Enterobacter asburiae]